MIAIEPHPLGAVLPVRAQPGARRNEIRGHQEGMLKVCVTQVAEKGKANKAVVDVLAEELGLRRSQLELVAGQTGAQKRFLVHGLSAKELARRVETRLAAARG